MFFFIAAVALILAYMNGNGNLCRTLVKAGASVGAMNKHGVTIFNYQVATKQLLHRSAHFIFVDNKKYKSNEVKNLNSFFSENVTCRLLDQLCKEPPWMDREACQECGTKFTITMRKHHWLVKFKYFHFINFHYLIKILFV